MSRLRLQVLNVKRHEMSAASHTSAAVLDAYTTAMTLSWDTQKAFDAAVWAWRERNPTASPEEAPPAVATIICTTL
jgi:hypothetical protein